jgi:hypothetical protein
MTLKLTRYVCACICKWQQQCTDALHVLTCSLSLSLSLSDLVDQANPAEAKYYKMARGSKGLSSRDLKPSAAERLAMKAIFSDPNNNLSSEQKQLLWKFRFSLTDDPTALVKFLRCVDWTDVDESNQVGAIQSRMLLLSIITRLAFAIEHSLTLLFLLSYFSSPSVNHYLSMLPNSHASIPSCFRWLRRAVY